MSASRISKVVVHPLRATLPKVQRTSQGDYPAIEIVVVEVETQDGFVGFGEGLCRRGAAGYARFIEEAVFLVRQVNDKRAMRQQRGVFPKDGGGVRRHTVPPRALHRLDQPGQFGRRNTGPGGVRDHRRVKLR